MSQVKTETFSFELVDNFAYTTLGGNLISSLYLDQPTRQVQKKETVRRSDMMKLKDGRVEVAYMADMSQNFIEVL